MAFLAIEPMRRSHMLQSSNSSILHQAGALFVIFMLDLMVSKLTTLASKCVPTCHY